MITRFARLLVVVILITMTGGHWVLLQSAAWTSMLLSNLAEVSAGQALTRTFDGQHPCRLCKAIESGKRSEHKTDRVIVLKKLEMLDPAGRFISSPASQLVFLPVVAESYSSFQSSPPVPPPRAA